MKRIVFVVAVVVVLLAGCNAKEQLGANIDAGQRHVEIMQDGIADGQARLDELKNDPDVDP
ncbi:MAG: lipoprotein, partial [Planctomycetota bacterium]